VLNTGFLSEIQKIGGIHDFITTLPRDTLIKWALTTEKYHNELNKIEAIGGLDDYINRMSNEEIISYILKEIIEHSELNSKEKLDSLSQGYGLNKVEQAIGGVHDYIWKMSLDALKVWALTTENYHKEINGISDFVGGLHDFINSMSIEELIVYIMKEIKEHPELTASEIESLSQKYGTNRTLTISDTITTMNRKNLTNMAFTLERYHHNGSKVFGGLHDRISKLSDDEIKQYILKELNEHPEIACIKKINNLSKEYKKKPKILAQAGNDGGLHDILPRMERKNLVKMAFLLERYHKNGTIVQGGLHDYVFNLSKSEVKDFIIKELKEHPEINNKKQIMKLTKEYGMKTFLNDE